MRTTIASSNGATALSFCSICSSIDFEQAFADGFGRGPCDRELYYQRFQHDCPLCCYIQKIISRETAGVIQERTCELKIRTSLSSDALPAVMPVIEIELKGSKHLPSRFIGKFTWQKQESKHAFEIGTNSVDFHSLKATIQHCKEDHVNSHAGTFPDEVPFLKLIDCHTREIFLAHSRPQEAYAALSYVWGSIDHGIDHVQILPDNLPATIEDALIATSKLDIKYLWVDRYCIDQQDERELSHQICLMDMVYQKAEVTIVAACGKDPTYGLPGVRKRPRQTQLVLNAGPLQFIETFPRTKSRVRKCRWMTRAWTYQEAVFSKRRLVFTDDQVYYDCHETHWYESWGESQIPQSRFASVLPHGLSVDTPKAVKHIQQYSSRHLGQPGDVINALSGLLHTFEVQNVLHHYWGVPITPTPPKTPSTSESPWNDAKAFLFGLSWVRMRVLQSARRRLVAPTWSWAGWETGDAKLCWKLWTTLNDYDLLFFGLYIDIDPAAGFKVELVDGRVLEWGDFLSIDMSIRQTLVSRFVLLSAVTTPVTVTKTAGSTRRHEAVINLDNNDRIALEFFPDTDGPYPAECIAIHLARKFRDGIARNEASETYALPLFLIVGQINGQLERIGLLQVGFEMPETIHIQSRLLEPITGEQDEEDRTLMYSRSQAAEAYDRMEKKWQTLRIG